MDESNEIIETSEPVKPSVTSERTFGEIEYECVRCGTKVTSEQLEQLPEIKCICGYRILKKTRPPVVKQVKSI
jgi:DNA-directed RNA polymerase subunit P